jgi:hypothetical protein
MRTSSMIYKNYEDMRESMIQADQRLLTATKSRVCSEHLWDFEFRDPSPVPSMQITIRLEDSI